MISEYSHEVDAQDLLKTIDPVASDVLDANDLYLRTGDASGLENLIARNPGLQPVVNMLLAPPRWTPEPWQICAAKNPTYLNSVWIGTVWNLIMLPSRFWPELLRPLLWGQLELALRSLLIIPTTTLGMFWFGLLGRMHSLPLSPVATMGLLVMEDEDAELVAAMSDNARMLTMIPRHLASMLTGLAAGK